MATDNPFLINGVSAAIQKRWQKLASHLITSVVEGEKKDMIEERLVDTKKYTYEEFRDCWCHLENEGVFRDLGDGTITYNNMYPRGVVR